MYADFAAATEELAATGLLDIDEAAYASHLDGNGPKKFVGTFTKREFNDLDSLIAQEREAVSYTHLDVYKRQQYAQYV